MLIQNYQGYGRYCYRISPKSKRNIGYFELWSYPNKNEIWSLRIIESQHNKGYGTRMLQEFLNDYKENKPLYLYVYKDNEIAIKLYEKVGFVIVGEYSKYAWTMQYMGTKRR